MSHLYDASPVFAQNWACTIEGWRRRRERMTPHFHRTLAELERSIALPLAGLRGIQARRLVALVERARSQCAYYRGIPPPVRHPDPEESIRRTLATIAPLEKRVLRERFGDFVSQDLPRSHLVSLKTSGTTGSALPVLLTRECLAEWFAVAWRQRRQSGAALDDTHATFGGQRIVPLACTSPPFWRENRAARQTLFSTYHLSRVHLPAYLEALHARALRYVQGYPSALHLVARALLDSGRPLPRGRLAAVFTSSETLLATQREAIEAGFGAPVRDFYSATEAAVAMSGCLEGRLHVDLEFCIVEVEPTETGPGFERGELLVTGLATDATPLLRYRIGDVGCRATTSCPCGRAGESFLQVDGRIEDYVLTPDGRRLGRMDHVFKDQRDVAEAQIVQDAIERLVVLVVPAPSWSEASGRNLETAIRARVGPLLEVEIRLVDSIARDANGKLRAVRSKLARITP